MKGIVFTELLEMVEDKFGFDMAESIIEQANLPHDGMYVASGTYPHQELVSIVVALSKASELPVPTLLNVYGKHLFGRLISMYPVFAEGKNNPLEFINSVHDIIHVEVRKLYPDAELPDFKTISFNDNELVIDYISHRQMEEFAVGLMEGCAAHYQQEIDIQKSIVEGTEKYTVRFTITMN